LADAIDFLHCVALVQIVVIATLQFEYKCVVVRSRVEPVEVLEPAVRVKAEHAHY